MIFSLNLPRTGGQTLQNALSILTGRRCWHSIEAHRWDDTIAEGDAGAVECHVPIGWLDRKFGRYSDYILATRDDQSWFESCSKVYGIAQDRGWSNPIWKYPLDSFVDYKHDYERTVELHFQQMGGGLIIDVIRNPRWDELCEFLDLPIPNVPFPNVDAHGRLPIETATFDDFTDFLSPFGGVWW